MFLYLSKIYYLLKGSRAKLIVILFVFLLTSLLEAVGIGLIGPFLDMATEPEKVRQISLLSNINKNLGFINSNNDFVAFLGVIITAIFFFKSVVYFLSKWQINKFSNDQRDRLVNLLIKSYLSLPYEFFLSRNTASLIKNVILETSHFSFLCLLPLLEAIANLTITAALLLLLAKTDPWLLISTLGVLVPVSLLFNTLSKKFKDWGVVVSESQREIVRTINHSLGGFKETRVFGCEQYFEKQIEEQARAHARATSLFQTFQMLPRVAIEAVLVIFLVLFVSISLVYSEGGIQELTAVLGVFAVAGMRIIPSSSMFLQSLASLRNGTHTLDVLYHDLREIESYIAQNDKKMSLIQKSSETNVIDKTENHSLSFNSGIQLSQVTYSYPGVDTPALNSLSLRIKKGQSIAFIGKSGAGKTTLVDLILGLLVPNGGDVRVDDVSIYKDIRAWQNLVGYIPQTIFLMDDTIERNIAFGVPDALIDHTKLQKAIEAAQLGDFINTLPESINTVVGERGVRLSGGQRQRIGIARALYHEREILVLDEATSALDTETEQLVSESISALAGTKTLIIIAHRLSTIEKCDYVYMLQSGEIIKSGSYQEVVSAKH